MISFKLCKHESKDPTAAGFGGNLAETTDSLRELTTDDFTVGAFSAFEAFDFEEISEALRLLLDFFEDLAEFCSCFFWSGVLENAEFPDFELFDSLL